MRKNDVSRNLAEEGMDLDSRGVDEIHCSRSYKVIARMLYSIDRDH
jgi:hypothetical protein